MNERPINGDAAAPSQMPRLTWWDGISLLVGITVAVSIFKSPALIFSSVPSPGVAILLWLGGGLLSLVGALCYAELATTYRGAGGDYEYLSRAFGKPCGFLFGWAQLTGVLTGSMGAVAFVFGEYLSDGLGLNTASVPYLAVAAVLGLTGMNLRGVSVGTAAQIVLTLSKIVGLLLIVGAGLSSPTGVDWNETRPLDWQGIQLAVILILYAYGGWNDLAFVAAEMRDPQRNIPLTLLSGIASITLLYLLMNYAYVAALGFEGISQSSVPAADVLQARWGSAGATTIRLVVLVSALGGLNGLIFSGSRVQARLGQDFRLFHALGRWNVRRGVPGVSFVVQAAVTIVLVLAVGTPWGRAPINALAGVFHVSLPWERFGGGFDLLVAATAPVFWGFFLLTGLSAAVLRVRDRNRARPYRMPLFPLPVILFCATCVFMLHASIRYAGLLSLLGLLPLALGLPVYLIARRNSTNASEA